MKDQLNIFDCCEDKFRFKKPLRMIQLFAGYGSQILSMKYLGVACEDWCISEWALNSIRAYKDLHHPDKNEDFAKDLTNDEIREWLCGRISKDYNEPMTKEQIAKLKPHEIRQICGFRENAMLAPRKGGITNTLTSVTKDNLLLEKANVIGNYHDSGHEASRIVDADYSAPTVKENHGTVTAVVEPINAEKDGTSRTIKAQYQQTSVHNFYETSTFGATG